MKRMDMSTWDRRAHFDFFSAMSDPFWSATFKVDVSALYYFAKAREISFYYALIWLCTRAVCGVEALRYCLQDGELYLLDSRCPSFTDMKAGATQFHIVTMPLEDDIVSFCRAARQKSRAQAGFIDPEQEGQDLIYFSCLPWLEVTALTNERNFDPDDAIPRITWGRYTVGDDGHRTLHMSATLNHRFADGWHLGQFYQKLQQSIDDLTRCPLP